ncbi:hypothetical protein Tco_1278328, partial [Tanacetum coccineum]
MTEAQQLSYTLAKSAKEAKAQENIKLVEQHILDEDVNKIVERDEFKAEAQEDPGTMMR